MAAPWWFGASYQKPGSNSAFPTMVTVKLVVLNAVYMRSYFLSVPVRSDLTDGCVTATTYHQWSIGYDAWLDNERSGFDPLLRQRIFDQ